MALYHMVSLWRQGRHNIQIGDNNNMFDFTYVENVAHAHLLAARALRVTAGSKTVPLDTERVDGEAFLITNDTPTYFWDFARLVWNAAGSQDGLDRVWHLSRDFGYLLGFLSEVVYAIIRKPPTLNRQRITYSTMTRYYDISKAKRRLGYKPIVGLEEGIRKSVKWILEQEKTGAIKA